MTNQVTGNDYFLYALGGNAGSQLGFTRGDGNNRSTWSPTSLTRGLGAIRLANTNLYITVPSNSSDYYIRLQPLGSFLNSNQYFRFSQDITVAHFYIITQNNITLSMTSQNVTEGTSFVVPNSSINTYPALFRLA